MSDFISRVMKHDEDGAFDGIHLYEGEFVAVIRYDEGHDSRSSYLTRDFLEAVQETSPLYDHAAKELAAETLKIFSYAVVNQEEENYLLHRLVDDKLHGFSFSADKNRRDQNATEYLLTQAEVEDMHDQANGQITEWLREERMESQQAKEAANHNLGVLYVAASTPKGPHLS